MGHWLWHSSPHTLNLGSGLCSDPGILACLQGARHTFKSMEQLRASQFQPSWLSFSSYSIDATVPGQLLSPQTESANCPCYWLTHTIWIWSWCWDTKKATSLSSFVKGECPRASHVSSEGFQAPCGSGLQVAVQLCALCTVGTTVDGLRALKTGQWLACCVKEVTSQADSITGQETPSSTDSDWACAVVCIVCTFEQTLTNSFRIWSPSHRHWNFTQTMMLRQQFLRLTALFWQWAGMKWNDYGESN